MIIRSYRNLLFLSAVDPLRGVFVRRSFKRLAFFLWFRSFLSFLSFLLGVTTPDPCS